MTVKFRFGDNMMTLSIACSAAMASDASSTFNSCCWSTKRTYINPS